MVNVTIAVVNAVTFVVVNIVVAVVVSIVVAVVVSIVVAVFVSIVVAVVVSIVVVSVVMNVVNLVDELMVVLGGFPGVAECLGTSAATLHSSLFAATRLTVLLKNCRLFDASIFVIIINTLFLVIFVVIVLLTRGVLALISIRLHLNCPHLLRESSVAAVIAAAAAAVSCSNTSCTGFVNVCDVVVSVCVVFIVVINFCIVVDVIA